MGFLKIGREHQLSIFDQQQYRAVVTPAYAKAMADKQNISEGVLWTAQQKVLTIV